MSVFQTSISIAYLLYIWFETNAFCEYYWHLIDRHLTTENGWFGVYEYKLSEYKGSYIEHIREHYDGFFSKLFTCPTCVSFWLALLSVFFVGLSNVLVVGFCGLLGYYLMVYIAGKAGH